MDKIAVIKSLHKILYLKEDIDNNKNGMTYEILDKCLSNRIIRFQGVDMDEALKEKIIETLKGLKVCVKDLTHDEMRSVILGLMNDVERGV